MLNFDKVIFVPILLIFISQYVLIWLVHGVINWYVGQLLQLSSIHKHFPQSIQPRCNVRIKELLKHGMSKKWNVGLDP